MVSLLVSVIQIVGAGDLLGTGQADSEQFERLALQFRRSREHVERFASAMRLDSILDDRRQVGQQGLEAMDRFAGGSALGASLGAGLRRDLGGLHHRLPAGLHQLHDLFPEFLRIGLVPCLFVHCLSAPLTHQFSSMLPCSSHATSSVHQMGVTPDPPAPGTCTQSDIGPDALLRTRRSGRNRVGLPSEPGRGF